MSGCAVRPTAIRWPQCGHSVSSFEINFLQLGQRMALDMFLSVQSMGCGHPITDLVAMLYIRLVVYQFENENGEANKGGTTKAESKLEMTDSWSFVRFGQAPQRSL